MSALLAGDALRLNPAQQVALPYHFSVVSWEARNLLSKWTHRLGRLLPWSRGSGLEGRALLDEYFWLGDEVRRLRDEIARAVARSGPGGGDSLMASERELARVMEMREQLKGDVEEEIESIVSGVLTDQGIASFGSFDFPPVDIRLDEPPKVLVTSPRDRIARSHEALVTTDVTVGQREMMEQALLRDADLSALVANIGGVATYPGIVGNTRDLRWTLATAAHEWLHHYLVANLTSLGLRTYSEPEMLTINETMVDMAGREIGDLAFEKLGGHTEPPPSERPSNESAGEVERNHDDFDFDVEMRATRRRADELLAAGAVQEAEAYMESRRMLFVENGFYIRKLNQAYFAINGTYAEGPQSSSPIGDQMREVRERAPDLKTFVSTMAAVSSHREFLDTLERLRAQGPG